MIPKSASEITLTDLNALLGLVHEGKTIEYKREMPARKNDEVIKFLAAVSSLANTVGGDLLIGIDAKAGLAHSIPGVAFDDLDAEKPRLEQLLANSIEPRLPRVEIEAVACADGRHVLVIRSHRSWIGPHRVTVNDKFYGRNSAGKYPLDVTELRSAFVLGESVAERIRNFRRDRLIKIAAGETPIPLHPGATMVVHAVPFSAFTSTQYIDIVRAVADGYVMALPPGRVGHPNNYSVNLDGFVTFTNAHGEPSHGYAQIFRSGAVEGVDVLSADDTTGAPYLSGPVFENTIVSAANNYLHFMQSISIELPIALFVSFCGMRGCHLRTGTEFGGGFYQGQPLRDDVIALPDVVIDRAPANVPQALRLNFNTVWNAFGHMKSDQYTNDGEWVGMAKYKYP
jgi:hypothetical protein